MVETLEHFAGGVRSRGRVGASMPERVPDHLHTAAALSGAAQPRAPPMTSTPLRGAAPISDRRRAIARPRVPS